jgi:hypothetical protein
MARLHDFDIVWCRKVVKWPDVLIRDTPEKFLREGTPATHGLATKKGFLPALTRSMPPTKLSSPPESRATQSALGSGCRLPWFERHASLRRDLDVPDIGGEKGQRASQ